MGYLEVAKTMDITPGTMKSFRINGSKILVSNIEGKFYAINNKCTHLGGDLSRGNLEGKIVSCPRHGSKYDVTTGKNITGPAKGIFKLIKKVPDEKTYNVKVEDGKIKVLV
jgi:3-phenylpropionate/trans-cinnamate dioxygenase ferredoxin subunit